MSTTIDEQEVKKFSDMADEWWSPTGKFKPLHKFNPIRISYIKNKIIAKFQRQSNASKPLEGLSILDIGCGGGLIAEPFANMGAALTAIDASAKNIEIAKIHAKKSGVEINYRAISAEDLIKENFDENTQKIADEKKFDVVFALEIIEHVADVEQFVKSCATLVKDDGILFIATINRTAKSFLLAKIGAEYVLRWLPKGTHSWQKFLKPSEINFYANACNLQLQELQGFSYNLLKDEWKITADDLGVNYIAVFEKFKN